MTTLPKSDDRTPRHVVTTSNSTTQTNEEAKIVSKNNRETKSSSTLFESAVSSMTAEQMSVELLGSVANLAHLVVSRGSFVTTEIFLYVHTSRNILGPRNAAKSNLGSCANDSQTRCRVCSAALLVSCLKLIAANMENLMRVRGVRSHTIQKKYSYQLHNSKHSLAIKLNTNSKLALHARTQVRDVVSN